MSNRYCRICESEITQKETMECEKCKEKKEIIDYYLYKSEKIEKSDMWYENTALELEFKLFDHDGNSNIETVTVPLLTLFKLEKDIDQFTGKMFMNNKFSYFYKTRYLSPVRARILRRIEDIS